MEKNISNLKSSSNAYTLRFIIAAIIQGAIIVGLTAFLVISQISFLKPEVSRVIAAGDAGTWFTFGYILYIVVGVIGVAVSAIFYYYLEKVLGKSYNTKIKKVLAWSHLILMNVGTVATMGMLMYAGYIGGAAMLPEEVGGKGFNPAQVHGIIALFIEPISISILMLMTGVVLGGLGFLLTYRSSSSSLLPLQ
jgi:heme/copper-type cytochrome/quinol oxidase subunit 1